VLRASLGFTLSATTLFFLACTSSEVPRGDGAPPPPAASADGPGSSPEDTNEPNGPGASSGGDAALVTDAAPSDAATSSLVAARPYAVKTPSTYDGSTALPLLLSLHGYTASAAVQESYFKLDALAAEEKVLLAMPDGTTDKGGYRFWNATDACCDYYASGVDDVAYLKAVIADMKSRFNVDPKRVYVVGHSNGGFMAHRLACEDAGEIAAIVSLAGAGYADATRCAPSEPVAVLEVHGDADQTVAYGGGSLRPGDPPFAGAKATIATWAAKNGCGATLSATGDKLDLDSWLPGKDTSVARHACAAGAAELWTIGGGSHIPALGSAWTSSFWAFLEAHPKP
jgi:polyhydroxybutyrate depolymerase